MLGDEYHLLLECPTFKRCRKKYIDEKFYKYPNMLKFNSLMQNKDTKVLSDLATFANILINKFNKVKNPP